MPCLLRPGYDAGMMTQQNLAFIMGSTRGDAPFEAVLRSQVEHFVSLGRRHLIVVIDTFPDLEAASITALRGVLLRAAELDARVTCVALDERTSKRLREMPFASELTIVRRVDELPGAA